MRIFSESTLRDYWREHPDCEEALRAWYSMVEDADWRNPDDVRASDPAASILGDSRVCFNIRGNRYRLIVHVRYSIGLVLVRWIGTHQEYGRIDAEAINKPDAKPP